MHAKYEGRKKMKELKEELEFLELYRKFIEKRGLNDEFLSYMIIELTSK